MNEKEIAKLKDALEYALNDYLYLFNKKLIKTKNDYEILISHATMADQWNLNIHYSRYKKNYRKKMKGV